MPGLLKVLFFALFVRPVVLIVLGLNCRGRRHLPTKGPAILAANHNSHLDALVLLSLFPLRHLRRVRPVAAADYFFATRLRSWVARHLIGIIALDRNSRRTRSEALFKDCHEALDRGEILILFPEGTRGEPEKLGQLKSGLYHLTKQRPTTCILPVVLRGLGRSLPRGEALFVPFNCDVIIGEPLCEARNSREMIEELGQRYEALFKECLTRIEVESQGADAEGRELPEPDAGEDASRA